MEENSTNYNDIEKLKDYRKKIKRCLKSLIDSINKYYKEILLFNIIREKAKINNLSNNKKNKLLEKYCSNILEDKKKHEKDYEKYYIHIISLSRKTVVIYYQQVKVFNKKSDILKNIKKNEAVDHYPKLNKDNLKKFETIISIYKLISVNKKYRKIKTKIQNTELYNTELYSKILKEEIIKQEIKEIRNYIKEETEEIKYRKKQKIENYLTKLLSCNSCYPI